MNCKILKITRLALAVMGLVFITAHASELENASPNPDQLMPLKDFELNYNASFNGMSIKGVHKLTQLDQSQFKEHFKAKGMLGNVTETEIFEIIDNKQIIPLENTYQRSVIGSKRTETQKYDWTNKQVTHTKGKKTTTIPLQVGYLDSMSHKQQLRRDMTAGMDVLTYPVISRGKLKQYTYKVILDEVLTTPIGPLDTRLIERISDDGDKTTRVWLAKDWDFIMIKLEIFNKGDTQKMHFTGGQLGNQTISPLEIHLEK